MPSLSKEIHEAIQLRLDPLYLEKKKEAKRIAERKRKIEESLNPSFFRRTWHRLRSFWDKIK